MEETWVRQASSGKEEKKSRRDSFGKDFERKLSIKPEMSVQKCRQEIAFYNAQIEEFFEEERGLVRRGLNLKLTSDVSFVTDADVEELFGKCTKWRTTNTVLNPDARKDLMDLYFKIYGSTSVTNNEFAGWLVKGYIVNLKKKKVNWALAASTTASEKADRVQRILLRLLNPDCSDDGTPSRLRQSSVTSQRGGSTGDSVGAMVKAEGAQIRSDSIPLGVGLSNLCCSGVSPNDLDKIRGVCQFESEILAIAISKASHVETECKKIGDRLIGFKFTMDDRRLIAKEDGEQVSKLQTEFEKAQKFFFELELQGIGLLVGSPEHEVFKDKLSILRTSRDSIERKVAFAQSVAESSRERAIKGEDFYQDLEKEHMTAESDLAILRREIVDMKIFTAAVNDQCAQMEKGGDLSLWPRPALHPPMPNDAHVNPPTLQLYPCVFCNRDYPYYDIVVASCKHVYQIFCAVAVTNLQKRCTRCDEVFHPEWLKNFGFWGAHSDFQDETTKPELLAEVELAKRLLKENGTRHVVNWSPSSVKHSDWGSSGSMQRSGNSMNTSRSTATATTSEHRLPSLASMTPTEETEHTKIGVEIFYCGGQEVDSPVKNWGVEHYAIGTEDVPKHLGASKEMFVIEGEQGQLCDQSKLLSESDLPDIPNFRCTLKTLADLTDEDGMQRKQVVLSDLGEENLPLALQSPAESPTAEADCTVSNSVSQKGTTKPKNSKRKACEQPPGMSFGRVSTRALNKTRM